MEYYIQRTVGKITDTLRHLWEGNDLPTFTRDSNPYLFSDRHTALRVASRLEARYPKTLEVPTTGFTTMGKPTLPSFPIKYEVVPRKES